MSKLPILMYHHVSSHKSKGLTIGVEDLENQLKYLTEHNYASHHFKDLQNVNRLDTQKNVIVTFDDVYKSQLELAYPLLKKYNVKATFFVPVSYIGKKDHWNTDTLDIMNVDELRSLDSSIVELGFHSFYHKKYNELTFEDIEQDTRLCMDFVAKKNFELSPVLAYPYGKYPKEKKRKKAFFEQLKNQGFVFGLRIGNRINNFPFTKPFEIQRIDVKGEYSITTFKRKLKFGKFF